MRQSPSRAPKTRKGAYERVIDALVRTLVRLRLIDPALDELGPASGREGDSTSSVVLPFPIKGEALLVKLANSLRERLKAEAAGSDIMLLLTLSRGRRSRLTIDRAVYVEFNPEDASFQLKVDAAPVLVLTLETKEFPSLVEFVIQYVVVQYGDHRQIEAAL